MGLPQLQFLAFLSHRNLDRTFFLEYRRRCRVQALGREIAKLWHELDPLYRILQSHTGHLTAEADGIDGKLGILHLGHLRLVFHRHDTIGRLRKAVITRKLIVRSE